MSESGDAVVKIKAPLPKWIERWLRSSGMSEDEVRDRFQKVCEGPPIPPPALAPMTVEGWIVLCRYLTQAQFDARPDEKLWNVFHEARKWAERCGISKLAKRDDLTHEAASKRFTEMLDE